MRQRRYYVYMLQSVSRRALYTGVTNNPFQRKEQHGRSDSSTFAGRYRTRRLVLLEVFEDVRNAIAREKQIKGWTRAKKEALIASMNPHWEDLSAEWKNRFKPDCVVKSGPSEQQQTQSQNTRALRAKGRRSG